MFHVKHYNISYFLTQDNVSRETFSLQDIEIKAVKHIYMNRKSRETLSKN